jgi:hypothetical protein
MASLVELLLLVESESYECIAREILSLQLLQMRHETCINELEGSRSLLGKAA